MSAGAPSYGEMAEAGWRWVLDQVRWADDGVWIPVSVPHDGGVPDYRDGMHSGVGGLAHALAEIALTRPWTDEETALAEGVLARVRADSETTDNVDYFDGLVSHLGVLEVLEAPGAETVVARLVELRTPDGWPNAYQSPPRWRPHARFNDATLGSASVLLGAAWAARRGVTGGADLAAATADLLVAEGEETAEGLNWLYGPRRHQAEPSPEMPNWSHGLAGVAAALTVAGTVLDRADLVDAGRRGAEHLVTLRVTELPGFFVPRRIPAQDGEVNHAFGWCHGPAGTSRLFAALEHAGVREVAGASPTTWLERCVEGIARSEVPTRAWPGYWDNDGRCCGTAGVGDFLLDAGALGLSTVMADAIVERAELDDGRAWWRFLEYARPDPLLDPGVGWMQGAAGIAAYLFRHARAVDGDARRVERLDTWWV